MKDRDGLHIKHLQKIPKHTIIFKGTFQSCTNSAVQEGPRCPNRLKSMRAAGASEPLNSQVGLVCLAVGIVINFLQLGRQSLEGDAVLWKQLVEPCSWLT